MLVRHSDTRFAAIVERHLHHPDSRNVISIRRLHGADAQVLLFAARRLERDAVVPIIRRAMPKVFRFRGESLSHLRRIVRHPHAPPHSQFVEDLLAGAHVGVTLTGPAARLARNSIRIFMPGDMSSHDNPSGPM